MFLNPFMQQISSTCDGDFVHLLKETKSSKFGKISMEKGLKKDMEISNI